MKSTAGHPGNSAPPNIIRRGIDNTKQKISVKYTKSLTPRIERGEKNTRKARHCEYHKTNFPSSIPSPSLEELKKKTLAACFEN